MLALKITNKAANFNSVISALYARQAQLCRKISIPVLENFAK